MMEIILTATGNRYIKLKMLFNLLAGVGIRVGKWSSEKN
jgi:hypothetical protein